MDENSYSSTHLKKDNGSLHFTSLAETDKVGKDMLDVFQEQLHTALNDKTRSIFSPNTRKHKLASTWSHTCLTQHSMCSSKMINVSHNIL